MNDKITTGIYPIGKPSPDGLCSHGWFLVELDADGSNSETVPPVLAVPKPLSDGQDYRLVIEAQAERIKIMHGHTALAVLDCTGQETDILAILKSGQIGLAEVPPDYEAGPPVKVIHMAQVDMQPFYDDHQHRLEAMQQHDPALADQQREIFGAMPAYRRAAEKAAAAPSKITVSQDDKDRIAAQVFKPRVTADVTTPDAETDPLKQAIITGKKSTDTDR